MSARTTDAARVPPARREESLGGSEMGRNEPRRSPLLFAGLAAMLLVAAACGAPGGAAPAATEELTSPSSARDGRSPVDGEPEPATHPPALRQGAENSAEATIIDQALAAIGALDLPGAASSAVVFRTETPTLLFACDYIPTSGRGGPLLKCEFGESQDHLTEYAEFWLDGGRWQGAVNPRYTEGLQILSSAAVPGAPPGNQLENGDIILEKARSAIQALDLSRSEAGYREFRITDPNLIFTCEYSPGRGGDEVPLLACKFGEFYNEVKGHALFWHDGGDWRAQLYPQAPEALAAERYRLFGALGSNCPVGCGSEFRAVRQAGTDALVVVDLSGVGTRADEEVHLLRREGDTWRLLWAPLPRDFGFRFRGSARRYPAVSLPEQGIDQFDVHYYDPRNWADPTVVTWVREGDAYVPLAAQR